MNEYLYKPLNLAEAESKPNVTLRYSERYFPADIYTDEREVGDYQITPTSPAPVRRPVSQVILFYVWLAINVLFTFFLFDHHEQFHLIKNYK